MKVIQPQIDLCSHLFRVNNRKSIDLIQRLATYGKSKYAPKYVKDAAEEMEAMYNDLNDALTEIIRLRAELAASLKEAVG